MNWSWAIGVSLAIQGHRVYINKPPTNMVGKQWWPIFSPFPTPDIGILANHSFGTRLWAGQGAIFLLVVSWKKAPMKISEVREVTRWVCLFQASGQALCFPYNCSPIWLELVPFKRNAKIDKRFLWCTFSFRGWLACNSDDLPAMMQEYWEAHWNHFNYLRWHLLNWVKLVGFKWDRFCQIQTALQKDPKKS